MFIRIFFTIMGCIHLFALGVICGIHIEERHSAEKEKQLMNHIQKLVDDNNKLQTSVASLRMDIFKKGVDKK